MTELSVQIKNQLGEFKPFESSLKEFKEKYDNVVYDLTDSKQEKQARSDRHAIGVVVGDLDRKHKEIKAPLSELVKLVDGKRKEIKDDLQNVQAKIKTQIEQHEAKIAEHEAMLKAKFEEIKELSHFPNFAPESKQLKACLDDAKSIVVDESFEHYEVEANIELVTQIEKLEVMLANAEKSEAEARELETLRREAEERKQRDHEERLKAEAAENARIESERKAAAEIARIEAEKQQALIDAENAKKEAERLAQQAVIEERQRAEREAQEQAEKAKAEQDAIDKKKAQKRYISSVLTKVKKSFISGGFTEKEAVKITELIRDNKVSNVQINW